MGYTIPKFTTSVFDDGFSPEDEVTKELYNEVGAFAKQGHPIQIYGPSGSGKEFLARHYYKIFTSTAFYKQYKQNWQTNYGAIDKLYSGYYSGESLKIFLDSIRAGIFWSINAATIYPNLAESILFGHEENAFNDAETSPGLLESLKYGVLFIDEIGELPDSVQAKFLRVIDSEIHQGSRIRGKMIYSVNDLIIIAATNKPRNTLREDFYYKLGIEVEIKGIEERPKDVHKSVPYFIKKAIGKRKDQSSMAKMFGTSNQFNLYELSETEQVKNYAEEQSELVINEILKRKWPGNFRSVRNVLDAALLRIESTEDLDSFSKEFRNNLHHYMAVYSDDNSNRSILVENSLQASIYPSKYPDMDRRIMEEIYDKKIFQNIDDFEKNLIAVFLSSTHKTGFKRKDLEEYYKMHAAIKHTSQSHIRNKINQLTTNKILNKTGNSKSTRYYLTEYFLDRVKSKTADIFSLPNIKSSWTDRDKEIDTLDKVLLSAERVYIQAPFGYGKSAFITMFCNTRKKQYNFSYYTLGEAGIKKFFEDIFIRLQSKNITLKISESLDRALNDIHPYLEKIFIPKEGFKPVLILDNVHFISDADDKRIVVELSKKWKEIILILIGDKMDNALIEDFTEFHLRHWGKQT